MTSSKPYLLRALHEWITDNGQTPLIVVDAEADGVVVPVDFVEDGKLVLNVSWTATRQLELGNEEVTFSARFAGKPYSLIIPVQTVLGIYSRESGQGMVFPEGEEFDDAESDAGGEEFNLTLVEDEPAEADDSAENAPASTGSVKKGPVAVPDAAADADSKSGSEKGDPDDDGPDSPGPSGNRKTRRSHLKVVK